MDEPAKFSILIVDDEKSNLDVLDHILKPEYQIYIAKSGQAAIKRAIQDKPDLILLDIIMPDMSGFDVLVELKESSETRDIPVIFVTKLASIADEEKGFILGAVDYITKPFNNSIVLARVRTHMQIVKQIRMIEKLGMIDSLTDLPNRRNFDHLINMEWDRAISEQISLSILTLDIDNFKIYNDTYGHPQGDILLQALAKVFVTTLNRPTDTVARIGGEEFIVILPNTDLNEALTIAERLRANVEATNVYDRRSGSLTPVTISIGATSRKPSLNDTITDFISQSDSALYVAKEAGRNKVKFMN